MMPAPTHLADWVNPDTKIIDEENFTGSVKCPCGNEIFEVSHPGETYEDQGVELPCTIKVAGKYFFLVGVKCTACSEEKVLFDANFHGWDGYVCHDSKQGKVGRPDLLTWNCSGCNSPKHTVRLNIQTEGKQDFIEESGGKFPEERWVDGFGWIDIDLTCGGCGKETKSWVSYETM